MGITSRCYGFVQGSDTGIQAFDTAGGNTTGPGSAPQSVTNAWHSLDIIVAYKEPSALNIVYYYLDGRYFWTGTSNGGYTNVNRIRSIDLIQLLSAETSEMKVLVDDIKLGGAALPVNTITAPTADNVLTTLTPTITWTREWDPTQVAATQVRVVSGAADPDAGVVEYDSGDVAGANESQMTGVLPNNTSLWVFERDKLTNGSYQPWTAARHFGCNVAPPGQPTVTTPNGTVATGKPMVAFTGEMHNWLRVKVATDSGGSTIVYDSGDIASSAYGYVSGILTSGSYYAFAKIGTVAGWSGWSAGHAFSVNRAGEIVDIRHMDEPDILTTDEFGPNDGFGHIFMYPNQYNDGPGTSTTVSVTTPVCGSAGLLWNDRGTSRSIRTHKIGAGADFAKIDLDNGVTFAYAVAVLSEGGANLGGASWRMAIALIMDKQTDGAETHFIAIRTLPTGIGIITDTPAGNEPYGNGYSHHWAAWPASTDYRIIRLTGRNQFPGDYSTTLWNVYVNENPTPVLTATGCLMASIMQPTIEDRNQGFQTDAIGIGHGSAGSNGDILFDWTAVNGSGDYASAEWNPFDAGPYASISEAKLSSTEPRPVSIVGPAVITKVVNDPFTGEQVAYYAQDVAGLPGGAGVRIESDDSLGWAVAEGAVITSLKGAILRDDSGTTIANPTVTIDGTAVFSPTPLSMTDVGGPCITQGAVSPDTTGMLVSVSGQVVLFYLDPNPAPNGSYVFYLDDGSGAVDGRETDGQGNAIPGIRFTVDAANPLFIPPNLGDPVTVEGIAGYETATMPDLSTAIVRQVMHWTSGILPPDTEPPGPASSFTVTPGDKQVALDWINPTDWDFTCVKILFKTTGYPTGPRDGTAIYNGPHPRTTRVVLVESQECQGASGRQKRQAGDYYTRAVIADLGC